MDTKPANRHSTYPTDNLGQRTHCWINVQPSRDRSSAASYHVSMTSYTVYKVYAMLNCGVSQRKPDAIISKTMAKVWTRAKISIVYLKHMKPVYLYILPTCAQPTCVNSQKRNPKPLLKWCLYQAKKNMLQTSYNLAWTKTYN